MPTYRVINKSTGQECYSYQSDTILDMDIFPLSNYSHIEETTPIPSIPSISVPNRVLTKIAFLRLFTQQERIAIRAAATTNPILGDFMSLLGLAEEVDITDQDIIGAVNLLEQSGILASGRAMEILNG